MSPHGSVLKVIKVTALNLFCYSSGPEVLSPFSEKFPVFISVQKIVLEGADASMKDDHLSPWSSSSSVFIRKKFSLRVRMD